MNFEYAKPAKALAHEEKGASHLRQEMPAPISDQPRANETDGLTTLSEAIREDHGFQGKQKRKAGTSSRK